VRRARLALASLAADTGGARGGDARLHLREQSLRDPSSK
jgi:hypothetical protein